MSVEQRPNTVSGQVVLNESLSQVRLERLQRLSKHELIEVFSAWFEELQKGISANPSYWNTFREYIRCTQSTQDSSLAVNRRMAYVGCTTAATCDLFVSGGFYEDVGSGTDTQAHEVSSRAIDHALAGLRINKAQFSLLSIAQQLYGKAAPVITSERSTYNSAIVPLITVVSGSLAAELTTQVTRLGYEKVWCAEFVCDGQQYKSSCVQNLPILFRTSFLQGVYLYFLTKGYAQILHDELKKV